LQAVKTYFGFTEPKDINVSDAEIVNPCTNLN